MKYIFDKKEISWILTSSTEEYKPDYDGITLVKKALEEKKIQTDLM